MTGSVLPDDHRERLERARLSLEGLSLGDAFGERFFGDVHTVESMISQRRIPLGPWRYTDDTVMALGILEVIESRGFVDQDDLAGTFARNYATEPWRGYGLGAHRILQEIYSGADWRRVATAAFNGMGSMGNGGAMRAAPLGAYFSNDLSRAAEQARLSAGVTHAHLEGQAGAVAVAVAAGWVWSSREQLHTGSGRELLEVAAEYTPESDTRAGILKAQALPPSHSIQTAASLLGNGSRVTSPDTVPFSLWCAARHLESFEEAIWNTVSGLGDRDTTCAIVGGIVILATGLQSVPDHWLQIREPLP